MNTTQIILRELMQIGAGKAFPIPFSPCDNVQNPFWRSL